MMKKNVFSEKHHFFRRLNNYWSEIIPCKTAIDQSICFEYFKSTPLHITICACDELRKIIDTLINEYIKTSKHKIIYRKGGMFGCKKFGFKNSDCTDFGKNGCKKSWRLKSSVNHLKSSAFI